MGDELATTQEVDEWGIAIDTTKDDITKEAAVSSFTATLRFVTATAALVGQGANINKFALVSGDKFKQLGDHLDFKILSKRPMALDSNAAEAVHDTKSERFQEIQTTADTVEDSGCMWGVEYLLWSPQAGEAAQFFCGTKTLRNEISEFQSAMEEKKPLSLYAKEIKRKKKKDYWSAATKEAQTIIEAPTGDALAAMLKAVDRFNNPPKEIAEEKAPAASKRAR